MYSKSSFLIAFLTFFCSTIATNTNTDFSQVVFVILSQPDQHHIKIANETKEALIENLLSDGVEVPKVFDLHWDFPVAGGWSIYPLLPFLVKLIDETKVQFHQHFMSSCYASRSQKRKKRQLSLAAFCTFGIKAACQHVDEIDTGCCYKRDDWINE